MCDRSVPASICSKCPVDRPAYNPTTKECKANCTDTVKPFFNQDSGVCEACPLDTPTYNATLQICEASCPGGTSAGNNHPFYASFELGRPNGTFDFRYETFQVKDRIELLYEGATIFDTGCTGSSATVPVMYSGKITNVIVRVTPNCAGTSSTAWHFDIACPA